MMVFSLVSGVQERLGEMLDSEVTAAAAAATVEEETKKKAEEVSNDHYNHGLSLLVSRMV